MKNLFLCSSLDCCDYTAMCYHYYKLLLLSLCKPFLILVSDSRVSFNILLYNLNNNIFLLYLNQSTLIKIMS